MRKSGKLGGLIAATLLAVGCYGPFNLTGKLYKWNGTVTENRWANEGIFLGCVIIPVYTITLLGDAIIFNSVEFWTGKNWISKP